MKEHDESENETKPVKYKNLTNRFTSENQPSIEAKRAGVKKHWEYRKARKQFFEKLCNIEMPDGSKRNFWDLVRQKMQWYALSDSSPLTHIQKVQLMANLLKEFMPEMKDKENEKPPVTIIMSKDDSQL